MKNLINNLIKFIYFLAVTEIIVAIILSSMYFGVSLRFHEPPDK